MESQSGKKRYPCDQNVKCGYPGCSFFGRLRSLDRHQKRRHPNQPKKIANSAFGDGGSWASWRVPLAHFEAGAVQEPGPQPSLQQTETADGPDPKRPRQETAVVTSEKPAQHLAQPSLQRRQPDGDGSDPRRTMLQNEDPTSEEPVQRLEQPPLRLPHSDGDGPNPRRPRLENDYPAPEATVSAAYTRFVASTVADMVSRVRTVESNQVKIMEMLQRPNETRSTTPTAVTEALLSNARDMASIQSATNHQIRSDPGKNIIYCETCVPELTEQVAKMNRVDGVFHYDFSLGVSFSKSEKMSKAFSNMKILLKQHLSSRSHKRHVGKGTKKAAANAERKDGAESVAIRVLREAFKEVKFSLAHVHLELHVVSHHRNNANMGDIGHSAAQMNCFRDAFWDRTMTSVKRFIAQQPCISLIADKATVNHRTIDITAVLCVVPEAPVKLRNCGYKSCL